MANMMIRINLLPVRQVKNREAGRQAVVLFAFVIAVTLAGNYFWYSNRAADRDKAQNRIADTNRRIAELEKVIGEVNNINKRKKEVEDKLKVLDKLRKGRAGPVKMLDALTTATPKKVFVSEFEEKQNAVKLKGTAASNEDVADLMRGLSTVVWTPKGMGRVVERKRDATTVRVELLSTEGEMADFAVAEVQPFFTNIDLKKAESKGDSKASAFATKRVEFEIAMSANYAI